MSEEICIIKNTGKRDSDMQFTLFYGGNNNGCMMQITQGLGSLISNDEPGFIQLTRRDALQVIIQLSNWLLEKELNVTNGC